MAQRRTILLLILLAASLLTLMIAYARMSKLRDDAENAQANFVNGRRTIAEIRQWKSSPGRATPILAPTPELNQHLRQAAMAAGLADVPQTETEQPRALGSSDYSEMNVDLRFEPLTLRQLVIFLHTLTEIDSNARSAQIELSPPDQPAALSGNQGAEELWRADVAVGYLTYTPRAPGR